MTNNTAALQQVRRYLERLPQAALVDWLMEVAERDAGVKQRLYVLSAPGSKTNSIVQSLRAQLERVTDLQSSYRGWRGEGAFIDKIDQTVDALEGLLTPDHAHALVELTQYALECVDELLEQMEDADGEVDAVVNRLCDLHYSACELAQPEPQTLAQNLFHLATTLEFCDRSFDPEQYKDLLGAAGLEFYRELAQDAFDELPPNGDGYSTKRYTITRIVEDLAKARGDVDGLIAIKAKNLSNCGTFFQIAQILTDHQRDAEALAWAERGLAAFPQRTDTELRDFLVGVYLKSGRNVEAVLLTWVQFEEVPGLHAYKKLHAIAQPLGVWPAQRAKALEHLKRTIADGAKRWGFARPHNERLVEIALWEGDANTAWDVLQQGQCDSRWHIAVAGALEATRPDDALSIYRRLIPHLIEQTNNAAYEHAVVLIRRVQVVMARQDSDALFRVYADELRLAFKRKINFIKLMKTL